MTFSAVVSLLDTQTQKRVESQWDLLETTCGLKGIRITPIPHISWEVAESHDLEPLRRALARRARNAEPLTIYTSGLGLFSGPTPVLYLVVVKTPALMEFHRQIWEEAAPFARELNTHYHPDVWIPHVTLAYKDINPANIGCLMEEYAFQTFDWEIKLDNLALVEQNGEEVGTLKERFPFGSLPRAG